MGDNINLNSKLDQQKNASQDDESESSYYYDEEEEASRKNSVMNIQQNEFLPDFSVNNSLASSNLNRKRSDTSFRIKDNLRQV